MKKQIIVIVSLIVIGIAGLGNIIVNNNRIDAEYTTAQQQLQDIYTTLELSSTDVFFFGDSEIISSELKTIKAYKTINNCNYYIVKDTDSNSNILVKLDNTTNKVYWYGVFDSELLDNEHKQNNTSEINKIL